MHFTIRRENKVEPAKIFRRERYADRRKNDIIADTVFLSNLFDFFGDKPFVRGNLEELAGYLIGRLKVQKKVSTLNHMRLF